MKAFLLSLSAGFGVGLLYALLKVKSPAPPIVALVGLLGMVAGEALLPFIRDLVTSMIRR